MYGLLINELPVFLRHRRVPVHGCRAFPDNPLVLPLQRLRQAVVNTRAAVQHLDELNRTLEAHNIEAGSK